MGDNTKIEWADASLNPVRARSKETGRTGWYCQHITPGCEHCYSEGFNGRLGTGIDFKRQNRELVDIVLDEKMLTEPLRWRRPRRIFWNSMTDTFGDFMPDEYIDRQCAIMAMTPQHTHLILTKRAKRMHDYFKTLGRHHEIDRVSRVVKEMGDSSFFYNLDTNGWHLENLWLGVSVEDQQRADERIPDLLATPAAKRFISAEPLLGPVNLQWLADRFNNPVDALFGRKGRRERFPDNGYGGIRWSNPGSTARLDLVITGGESGPGARPAHPDWFRSLRAQCEAAGVAFFFKQWGEWVSVSEVGGPGQHYQFPDGATVRRVGKARAGRTLDGRTHDELPA